MIDFTKDNLPTTTDERMLAYESISRIELKLGYLDSNDEMESLGLQK